MKRIIAAMALAAAAPAALADCNASSTGTNQLPNGYSVDAMSMGETCETAVILLVMRDSEGKPAYTWASGTDSLFGISYATTAEEMTVELDSLTGLSDDWNLQTSSELDPWPEDADGPVGGEFFFYPSEWVDREYYEAVRADDVPVFCHVQGMESLSCMALYPDRVEVLGFQTFPG